MLTILFLIIYTLSLYNIYRNDLSEITLLNRNTFVKRDIYFFMIVILLMIIMGVAEFHDYFMTINFGSGTLSVPNEIKDQCAELQAYLVQRNPKIQVIKNY